MCGAKGICGETYVDVSFAAASVPSLPLTPQGTAQRFTSEHPVAELSKVPCGACANFRELPRVNSPVFFVEAGEYTIRLGRLDTCTVQVLAEVPCCFAKPAQGAHALELVASASVKVGWRTCMPYLC
jgi:hypothetical protein